jgi:exocyst complex component 3
VAGSLDVEAACRGFLDLAKEGAAACVAVVFSDPAFADLFTRLYWTEEWRSGDVTSSVLATLEDFLQDFERMVLPTFYRRWGLALE